MVLLSGNVQMQKWTNIWVCHSETYLDTGKGDNYAIYKLSNRTISQTLKHPQELQQKMLYHKKNAFSAHVQYHSIVFFFFVKYNSGCTVFLTQFQMLV